MSLTLGGLSVQADDNQTLESFLARLGLVDLQIRHLEQNVEATTDQTARAALAKRLANLYAERLMDVGDEPARYDEIVARIQLLLQDVPQANTPALQVMLLQADYNRAETQIVKWINDRGDTTALDEANKVLAQIAPLLDQHQTDLNDEVDRLNHEADQLNDEDAQAAKEQDIHRLQALAGRAMYFAGWANYYFGVGKQDPRAGAEQFKTARATFRKLLGIADQEKYEAIEQEWLGLESIWRSRALIGLALAEIALDDLDSGRACFKLLDHVSAPPVIRDQSDYWQLQGLLNARRISDAVEFAAQQVEKYSGGATPGKVGFCVALIRNGFGRAALTTPALRRLGELGIQGLARLRQFPAIHQLMAEYDVKQDGRDGFYLTWIRGQQQFNAAEKSKSPDDYQAAEKTLSAALGDRDAQADVGAAAECRYILAWCIYRLGDYEQAAQQFQQASAAMKQAGSSTAVDAAWMTSVAYQRLSDGNARYSALAIDALKAVKRDFPESKQAQKVDFFIAKLQQSSASPEESIRALQQIKPGDANFTSSRYDLCLLYYQQWSNHRDDARRAASDATDLRSAVDQYLNAARRDADDGRKLKAVLLAVDVAMRGASADLDNATSYLAKARPLAEALLADNSAVQEYHYQQFQAAKLVDDNSAVAAHASWLAENAAGSAYERSAVISLAKVADESLQSAADVERPRQLANAVRIYTRLVDVLGDSAAAISSNKNARVANSRLADYESESGQFAAAAERLDKILAAYPQNREYLRRAGLAHFQAGNFAAALPSWRTLSAGLEDGTADWFEAKYYQIACLAKTDPNSARQVYRQFKLLHPAVKVDSWRDKFVTLDRELGHGD